MPELPEVEVVRRGIADHAVGRTVTSVEVLHPRSVRRQPGGGTELAARLAGRTLVAARRRGKFLWIDLDDDTALLAHLGMSGQLLVQPGDRQDEKHLRVRLRFSEEGEHADRGAELRFVDQRTFGGLTAVDTVESDGERVPVPVAHIGRDPLDPRFDLEAAVGAYRRRRTELKRALLDQTVVSGIGNIYADEALWRARLHSLRPTARLTRPDVRNVLGAATEVMTEALAQGGTSFDALYVDVHGESGYFERSLAVYGREDEPCYRCGTAIRRSAFMNRSSYWCPRCQRVPRHT
ncbi:bifunctional DNA-formamidopyrimidine glycosylase/DNA-(apurinic or apyrimidinic site) lyase [Actinomycetospora termitidis]|uniref:Formamidopyrimidine-DNA glycosylase n=1 Tax=Actinomycetospora termitidis TaxID=3053470 RepID=A0ABT7M6U8_9PSEU|nr:bifunctional DNA-formamidopyrimidine glycosylase/DNA-(apurinic or apyrimidinic site) lyase [Actinomycetospora sp. Odt1-22]MDL5155954.1 bifunctional DNA-formamidopyrimidine glycosylase/DNA-(apurinic or apyrimidinic site) lyase [Actinomycetospora sp. Odt1-22]